MKHTLNIILDQHGFHVEECLSPSDNGGIARILQSFTKLDDAYLLHKHLCELTPDLFDKWCELHMFPIWRNTTPPCQYATFPIVLSTAQVQYDT